MLYLPNPSDGAATFCVKTFGVALDAPRSPALRRVFLVNAGLRYSRGSARDQNSKPINVTEATCSTEIDSRP